jgi:hypothetical protein
MRIPMVPRGWPHAGAVDLPGRNYRVIDRQHFLAIEFCAAATRDKAFVRMMPAGGRMPMFEYGCGERGRYTIIWHRTAANEEAEQARHRPRRSHVCQEFRTL